MHISASWGRVPSAMHVGCIGGRLAAAPMMQAICITA